MKKGILVAAVPSLALAFLWSGRQAAYAANQPAAAVKPKTFTITGRLGKAAYAYIIHVRNPPERYLVMNPNPEILDRLVKNSEIVTIEAARVIGDNVNIRKINGAPYAAKK